MNSHLCGLVGTGLLCHCSLSVEQSASAPQPILEELRQLERERVSERRLMEAVVRLRGARPHVNDDLFVGAPIKKPEGFRTAQVALNYSF